MNFAILCAMPDGMHDYPSAFDLVHHHIGSATNHQFTGASFSTDTPHIWELAES